MFFTRSVSLAQRGFRRFQRTVRGTWQEERQAGVDRYRKFTGREPDLENPTGFLEKLLWLSLYHRDPQIPPLVDKWLARPLVARRAGDDVLNELFGVWDDVEQIPFDQLPDRFVLKATAGSGYNVFCRDRATFDRQQAMQKLRYWQRQRYYDKHREWQYRPLRSRLIAERLMTDEQHPDRPAADIKIFCFNGEPRVLGVCTDRWGDTRHNFFDQQWNPVDYGLAFHPPSDPPLARPDDLPRVLEVARQLSAGFLFVRVDLYRHQGRVIFGEMTFSPSAGRMQIQMPDADALWGSWLTLLSRPSR